MDGTQSTTLMPISIHVCKYYIYNIYVYVYICARNNQNKHEPEDSNRFKYWWHEIEIQADDAAERLLLFLLLRRGNDQRINKFVQI